MWVGIGYGIVLTAVLLVCFVIVRYQRKSIGDLREIIVGKNDDILNKRAVITDLRRSLDFEVTKSEELLENQWQHVEIINNLKCELNCFKEMATSHISVVKKYRSDIQKLQLQIEKRILELFWLHKDNQDLIFHNKSYESASKQMYRDYAESGMLLDSYDDYFQTAVVIYEGV